MQWFELLLSFGFALIAYMFPVWMMFFQKKMRQMEMENEVMQFPNNYSNAYENRKSKCRNDFGMARALF